MWGSAWQVLQRWAGRNATERERVRELFVRCRWRITTAMRPWQRTDISVCLCVIWLFSHDVHMFFLTDDIWMYLHFSCLDVIVFLGFSFVFFLSHVFYVAPRKTKAQSHFYPLPLQIQIQIQLYWPGLRTNEEFDFGPFALYVQHSTFNLLLIIYKKEKKQKTVQKNK